MSRMLSSVLWLLLFVVWLSPEGQAQLLLSPTGQPTTYDSNFDPANITGFGEARWGQSPDDVKDLLTQRYPDDVIEENVDPVHGTRVLTLTVEELAPVAGMESPGVPTLNYVFGADSQRLAAIHLSWIVQGDATEEERSTVLEAGTAYVSELLGYEWAPLQSVRGHVIGPGAVILFAGRDGNGAGVEVRVEGVTLDVMYPDGKVEHWPVTTGLTRLYIGLAAQPDQPDVFRLPENSF